MAEVKTLHDKLLAVQKDLPKLEKDADGVYNNKYVTLHQLLDKVLPLLNKQGLLLKQKPSFSSNGQPTLETSISDGTNATTTSMLLMLKGEDPQAQGSAITYARRYSLMAMLGLVGEEDDDGQTATDRIRKAEVGEPSKTGKGTFNPEATLKQKNAIKAMAWSKAGIQDQDQFTKFLFKQYGADWEKLSVGKASEIIEDLGAK